MQSSAVLGFGLALVLAAVIVFGLGGLMRRHPGVVYGAALVATASYGWALVAGVDLSGIRWLTVVLQKGYLASILLGVVMFTGVLAKGSALRRRLQPIRGELSVLSFILILGHLATYLPPYLGRFGVLMASRTNVAFSLVVAMVLTALFAVLGVTSLRAVHRVMNPRLWKAIQRGAYLMVALLALHVALVLGKSALAGGAVQAAVAFWAYMAVVAVYAVLRVRRAVLDRRPSADGERAGEGVVPAEPEPLAVAAG